METQSSGCSLICWPAGCRQMISSEVFCLSVLVCRAFVHQSAATMYLPADIGEPLFRV